MKKVLIINGHPDSESFCQKIAETYKLASELKGNEVQLLNVHEMEFSLNLAYGFRKRIETEQAILNAQQLISWSNHIVIIHPVWWGSVPALLKGFFDRVLTPGFAFKYRENSPLWDKLLKGKTGQLIYTSDTPTFIYKYFYGAPSVNTVKRRVMQFCGISPVKVTGFGSIRSTNALQREKILNKVKNIA